jgi:hypothetical protein
MGRYRPVDPRIWSDEKFKLLSKPKPNAQTLWLFLLTGPHSDGCPGLFHRGEMALAEELGWSLNDFRKVFKEIENLGMAFADWEARVVLIPNAIKYDPPQNPNIIKKWAYNFEGIPNCELKWRFYKILNDFIEKKDEKFKKVFRECFGYLRNNEETITKTISKTIPKTIPEMIPETISKTIPETISKTIPETIPETIDKNFSPISISIPYPYPIPNP